MKWWQMIRDAEKDAVNQTHTEMENRDGAKKLKRIKRWWERWQKRWIELEWKERRKKMGNIKEDWKKKLYCGYISMLDVPLYPLFLYLTCDIINLSSHSKQCFHHLTESRRRRDMFLFQIMHNSLLPLSSYHHCNHNHHDHTTHPRVLQSADRKPLSKHGYRNTVEQKSIWHLQILHLVSLKKMVEGFYLHHRNTSTVRDMLKKYQRSPIVGFLQNLFV